MAGVVGYSSLLEVTDFLFWRQIVETTLVAWRLGPCASAAEGPGLIPGQGTKIPKGCGMAKKKKKQTLKNWHGQNKCHKWDETSQWGLSRQEMTLIIIHFDYNSLLVLMETHYFQKNDSGKNLSSFLLLLNSSFSILPFWLIQKVLLNT